MLYMEILYFVLAVCCGAYYICITSYAGITANFAWIWIFNALTLLLCGAVLRYHRLHSGLLPGKTAWILVAVRMLIVLAVLFPLPGILGGMRMKTDVSCDYAIVLGAQVRGTRPSRALLRRLEKALEYGKDHPDVVLVLSGAQGPGEDITEAVCMETWLRQQGCENKLVLEERSTDTLENLKYSDGLTGCADAKTGIISNDFHVFRSVLLSRKAGYAHVTGIPAKGDPVMELHYIVRECFALWKEKLKGNI